MHIPQLLQCIGYILVNLLRYVLNNQKLLLADPPEYFLKHLPLALPCHLQHTGCFRLYRQMNIPSVLIIILLFKYPRSSRLSIALDTFDLVK